MKIKTIYQLAAAFLLSINSFSQTPGTLDNSFDTDGKLTVPIGNLNSLARALVIQPDQKIVLAGFASGNLNDFGLMRLLPDGSPDNSFGTNGSSMVDFSSSDDFATSVAQQNSTGRMVVGGYSFNGNGFDFALACFLPGGSLDSSFGINGKCITTLGATSFANAVAFQPDGKIILAGYTLNTNSGFNEFALVRYNTNGDLDSSFNGNGKVLSSVGSDGAVATSMALQPDGKIILAGQSFNALTLRWEMAVARFNMDGSPDNTFDTDGKVITSTGNTDNNINAVTLQPDGKIIIAGYNNTAPSNSIFILARYNMDGSPDAGFGNNGMIMNGFPQGANEAYSVIVQPDGKIIAGGAVLIGTSDHFAIARYNADGTPDNLFGNNGKVNTSIGLNDGIRSMCLQADGKLVVAGTSFSGNQFNFAAARYETGLSTSVIISPESGFSGISVYPNPARREVTLTYTLDHESEVSIMLYDSKGSCAMEMFGWKNESVGINSRVIYFPSDLREGNYFINLKSGNGEKVIKILIMK